MPDDLLSLEPEPEDFAATFDPPSPDMPSVAAKEEIVFPEESKLAFEGLFYIGMLRSTPTWAGHSFVIRTITSDEALEVGLVAARWRDTAAESRAYGTALVAACLESIDGKPVPSSILADGTSPVQYRFDWVKQKLHPPVVDYLYEEYRKLEVKVEEVLAAMGKAGGSTAG